MSKLGDREKELERIIAIGEAESWSSLPRLRAELDYIKEFRAEVLAEYADKIEEIADVILTDTVCTIQQKMRVMADEMKGKGRS